VKIMRPLGAVGIAASAFLLAACGSDPAASNSSSSSAAAPAASGTAQIVCGGKSPLSGEGSTAQKNAIDVFTLAYGKQCSGQQVNYTASGSGAGVKQFNGNQVDFGGSDSPIIGADLDAATKRCASPAWNIPMVVGPVAVAYKLQGVDKLTLTPTVIAKIFNGGIKNWNDPAIKAIKGNEASTFQDKPIQVISRSDDSGTTDNFQNTSVRPPRASGPRVRARSSTAGSAAAPRAPTVSRPRSRPAMAPSPTSRARSPRTASRRP
jgi:phosphate transport system substrate-binding protein